MLKIITGMFLATILLGIGFYAGQCTVRGSQAVEVASLDDGFAKMIADTTERLNQLPVKGKKS